MARLTSNKSPLHETTKQITRALRSFPNPSCIARSLVIVVAAQFIDGPLFFLQVKIYARDGIDLSRQTMSDWIVQLEEKPSP